MVEKDNSKKHSKTLGIAGFTLALAGIYCLILMGPLSAPIFVTGLIFCWIQQRRNPMYIAKVGLIINILGIVGVVIWSFFVVKYIMDLVQQGQIPV